MTYAWTAIIANLLAAVKVDIGITTDAYDDRLLQYIMAAYRAITTEGIVLDVDDDMDKQLVVMYTAWLWRRRDGMEGMPRMIRYALNNRLFSQKMAVSIDE